MFLWNIFNEKANAIAQISMADPIDKKLAAIMYPSSLQAEYLKNYSTSSFMASITLRSALVLF